MMSRTIIFFATGFGLGFIPKAPGTAGSLLGVFLILVCQNQSKLILVFLALALFLFSSWVAHRAEKIFQTKDCQKIVIDEVVGQFITLLFLPAVLISWKTLLLGFVLFRIFDVIKIFPARWAQDHISGGLGIVADDVVAGLHAGITLWTISKIWTW